MRYPVLLYKMPWKAEKHIHKGIPSMHSYAFPAKFEKLLPSGYFEDATLLPRMFLINDMGLYRWRAAAFLCQSARNGPRCGSPARDLGAALTVIHEVRPIRDLCHLTAAIATNKSLHHLSFVALAGNQSQISKCVKILTPKGW